MTLTDPATMSPALVALLVALPVLALAAHCGALGALVRFASRKLAR